MNSFSLIPKNDAYFTDFNDAVTIVGEMARLLHAAVMAPTLPTTLSTDAKAVERRADAVVHRCLERLDTSFITPIEREDIHQLIIAIDDMGDMMEAVCGRFAVYGVEAADDHLRGMMTKVVEIVTLVGEAVANLRSLDPAKVRVTTRKVRALEDEVDALYRAALGALFARRPEAYDLVRWKELYDWVEETADRGRIVARTVDHILVRHS